MSQPAEILRYLAGLTPGRRSTVTSSLEAVATPRDFVWLGTHPLHDPAGSIPPPNEWWDRSFGTIAAEPFERWVEGMANPLLAPMGGPTYSLPRKIRSEPLDRLARRDALDPGRNAMRLGAMWVAGRRLTDRRPEPILFPAVVRRVRIHEAGGVNHFQPQWLGPAEPHPAFDDVITDEERDIFSSRGPSGELVRNLCTRIGLPPPVDLEGDQSPLTVASQVEVLARHEAAVVYLAAGTAAFLIAPEKPTTIAAGLHRWSTERLEHTAFARLYDTEPVEAEAADGSVAIESPLPTNERQRLAIARAREADVSVVSGPPGTGKTHLVVAAAIDAIAAGGAVLIATKSDHAAESVCEVLERHPSPAYVRFGRAEDRQRVAEQLMASHHGTTTDRQHDEAEEAAEKARAHFDELSTIIHSLLEREAMFEEGLRNRSAVAAMTADAPAVRDPTTDLAAAAALVDRARDESGLFGGWRARRAGRRLRSVVGAPPTADVDTIERAIRFARVEHEVTEIIDSGGTALTDFWGRLDTAEYRWREALAAQIDVRRRRAGRLHRRRARTSVAALANVLRTGVARRSELLSAIESDDFLDMLPLWVGTLDEVERTLPVVPGLFDLVILDEASQIDQILAAGALCRAERVMVVGDPRQLRHVSFISDERMDDGAAALPRASLELQRLLDVRRNSLFDVAAAASAVTWLNEHFRSVPHLIEFSDHRFYDGSLRLMTQHPRAEGHDAIDLVRVDGVREDGVNQVEVDTIRELVADLMYRPDVGSIGVVSPFRKQADALVDSLRDRFTMNQMRWSGLRAGTVHEFQGIERDTMIISLSLGVDDLARSLRFVEDPNLFNVMITRARQRIVVVTSFDAEDLPTGLLADYHRFSHLPPAQIPPQVAASEWTRRVAASLADGGHRVVTGYPVAGHAVDIALGTGTVALGIECGVHPDGVATHIERHLALRRAGWDLVDAFQSRWTLNPEELAVWLTVEMNERVKSLAPPAPE